MFGNPLEYANGPFLLALPVTFVTDTQVAPANAWKLRMRTPVYIAYISEQPNG